MCIASTRKLRQSLNLDSHESSGRQVRDCIHVREHSPCPDDDSPCPRRDKTAAPDGLFLGSHDGSRDRPESAPGLSDHLERDLWRHRWFDKGGTGPARRSRLQRAGLGNRCHGSAGGSLARKAVCHRRERFHCHEPGRGCMGPGLPRFGSPSVLRRLRGRDLRHGAQSCRGRVAPAATVIGHELAAFVQAEPPLCCSLSPWRLGGWRSAPWITGPIRSS